MNKKNYVIIQRITDPDEVKKIIKSSNGIINPNTLEIIIRAPKKTTKKNK